MGDSGDKTPDPTVGGGAMVTHVDMPSCMPHLLLHDLLPVNLQFNHCSQLLAVYP
jgi:hypothetical protein